MEPIPVPTQKLAYQQIQESLIRSRTRSGESAMSGISSAGSEGASTLGPLPEEGTLKTLAAAATRNHESGLVRKSPTASPSHHLKSRRVSAPTQPIPDICQLSPPSIQFTLGSTPPTGIVSGIYQTAGGRRRTSSSSSCGTPPPSVQWQVSPNSPIIGTGGSGRITPTMTSPVRRHTIGSRAEPIGSQAAGSNQIGFYNNPNGSTLSPILGSPNKATIEGEVGDTNSQVDNAVTTGSEGPNPSSERHLVQGNRVGSGTLCIESASDAVAGAMEGGRLRSTDLQFPAGRNVVLNFGAQGFGGLYDRPSKLKTKFVGYRIWPISFRSMYEFI